MKNSDWKSYDIIFVKDKKIYSWTMGRNSTLTQTKKQARKLLNSKRADDFIIQEQHYTFIQKFAKYLVLDKKKYCLIYFYNGLDHKKGKWSDEIK